MLVFFLGLQVPNSCSGKLLEAVETLTGRRERKPGVLRGRQLRSLRALLLFGPRFPRLQFGNGSFDLRLPVSERSFISDLGLEGLAKLHEIVRQEPKASITNVGLDDHRPASHLGLPSQRLQLPAQLRGEVLQPGEIAFHRIEFA